MNLELPVLKDEYSLSSSEKDFLYLIPLFLNND